MAKCNDWSEMAGQVIYEAYPDQDLLPIEPPKPGETIGEFALRTEDAGDTLFVILCREADEQIDAQDYITRLDRAIDDIESVRDAFLKSLAQCAKTISEEVMKYDAPL